MIDRRSFLALGGAALLTPALNPAFGASSSVRPISWTIGYDASGSVPPVEFAQYPEIVRRLVLERTAASDTVSLLRLDDVRFVSTVPFDGRLSSHRRETARIFESIRSIARRRGGYTDFVEALAHLREQIDQQRRFEQRPRRFVAVFVTDGEHDPDPRASQPGKVTAQPPLRADYRLAFVGARSSTHAALRELCVRAGFVDDARIRTVPFGQWRAIADGIGGFTGRSTDAYLTRALDRAARSVSQRSSS